MSKPKNEDLKIVDRRKARRKKAAEGSAEPAEEKTVTPSPEKETVNSQAQPQEPRPAEEAPQAETQAEKPSEQIPAVDAYGVLRLCIGLLSAQAWQCLGLVADPASGEAKKDLEQARLCIDSVAALVERLSPGVELAERRELENLVSNLRLNFVTQSQASAGP